MKNKWIMDNKEADISLMSSTLGISPVLSQVLVNRSIRTKNTAIKFLNPKLDYFHNIHELKDLEKATEILKSSLKAKEKIAIFGDYDVDGVMSTVILYKTLAFFGANLTYYIPDREKEGYALNKTAIEKLKNDNVDLIIACDNGIAAIEEIEHAKNLGMRVIVIDHHEAVINKDLGGEYTEVLPDADAIINPKQKECGYKFKLMCAAGVCYRFAQAFFEHMKEDDEAELLNELLIFASIATFCDVVELQEDNRIIANYGLQQLNGQVSNIGLLALMEEKNLKPTKIDEFSIGFVIGPCINAAGRLKTAALAVQLFLTEDIEEAKSIAKELSQLNEERKLMTKAATEDILEEIAATSGNVLVLYSEKIHESIAGIVAGRIKDKLNKPTIVLTKGDNMAKGSARSIVGYNIFYELSKCKELFDRFGGHEMAAGLSLPAENIDELRNKINKNFAMEKEQMQKVITIEKELELKNINYALAKELTILQPFGKGNDQPVFLSRRVRVKELRLIEEKNTIIFGFEVEEYRNIKGISFGLIDQFKEIIYTNFDSYDAEKITKGVLRNVELFLDIVYYIDINDYNGDISIQLKIVDMK